MVNISKQKLDNIATLFRIEADAIQSQDPVLKDLRYCLYIAASKIDRVADAVEKVEAKALYENMNVNSIRDANETTNC